MLLIGLALLPASASARDSTSYNPAAMQVRSSIPIGTIIAWPTNSLPASGTWVECDGRNGTPDLRGRFIRGLGGRSGALGQVQAEETKAHFHTVQQHSHTVTGEAGGQEVVVTPQVVSGEASSQQVEVGSQEVSGKATGEYIDMHQETGTGAGYRGDGGYAFVSEIYWDPYTGSASVNGTSHSHSINISKYFHNVYGHNTISKFDGEVTGKTVGGTYETKGGTITGKTAGGTYMTGGGTITGVTNMAGNNTDYTGGVETRPENVALRYIMKIR